jgi:hypothetical protein
MRKYPTRPDKCYGCGKKIDLDSNFCDDCLDDYMKQVKNGNTDRSRFCEDAI